MDASKQKNKPETSSEGFLCSWDAGHNLLHRQSLWLQLTLSDLEEKIDVIQSIIERYGDSYSKRVEMSLRKRRLIELLDDLKESYRSLAVKYDHLRSGITQLYQPKSFSPSLCVQNNNESLHPGYPELVSEHAASAFVANKTSWSGGNFNGEDLEMDQRWSEQKLSGLIEENLHQQAELIRRNEKKGETIQKLWAHINRLVDENEALKTSLATQKISNPKGNLSRVSEDRSKGPLFFEKLTGCSCSK